MEVYLATETAYSETANINRSVLLLEYQHRALYPGSFLSFMSSIDFHSQRSFVIYEPRTMCPLKIDYISTPDSTYEAFSAKFHTRFQVRSYQTKSANFWIVTPKGEPNSIFQDIVSKTKAFKFDHYICTKAIPLSSVSTRLKTFAQFMKPVCSEPPRIELSSKIKSAAGLTIRNSFANNAPTVPFSVQPHPSFRQSDMVTDDCNELCKGLWIGNERSADLLNVRHLDITRVVNLNGIQHCIDYPTDIDSFIVKMQDSPFEQFGSDFMDAIDFVDEALKEGRNVLVHCRAGISRSAALCIAYFIKIKGYSYEGALAFLKEKRPVVSINQGFQDQLRELADTRHSKRSLLTVNL